MIPSSLSFDLEMWLKKKKGNFSRWVFGLDSWQNRKERKEKKNYTQGNAHSTTEIWHPVSIPEGAVTILSEDWTLKKVVNYGGDNFLYILQIFS